MSPGLRVLCGQRLITLLGLLQHSFKQKQAQAGVVEGAEEGRMSKRQKKVSVGRGRMCAMGVE